MGLFDTLLGGGDASNAGQKGGKKAGKRESRAMKDAGGDGSIEDAMAMFSRKVLGEKSTPKEDVRAVQEPKADPVAEVEVSSQALDDTYEQWKAHQREAAKVSKETGSSDASIPLMVR